MRVFWAKHVPSAAVDGIGNVWSSVSRQIKQHPNNTAVTEAHGCSYTIFILDERLGLSRHMLIGIRFPNSLRIA
jgi:hypothetical protein